MSNRKDFFYKPKLEADLDYLSEKTFDDIEEDLPIVTPDDVDIEELKEDVLEIVRNIEKVKKIINILPSNLPENYRDLLNKIKHDLLNPPDPIIPTDPSESTIGDQTEDPYDPDPLIITPGTDVPSTTFPGGTGNIIIGGTKEDPIYLFPPDNDVSITINELRPLVTFIRDSFMKDKIEMYDNFVRKFKLMIQQYMRELLYVAKIGEFDSYLDLYIYFDTPTSAIPKDLRGASDRITKNQITRDSKTKLLNKILNIDQTVYHLIACKAAYEQRQRYYDIDYLAAKDYVDNQENDELRKLRLEYDKKYEQNMYNYYKYLTGSSILADEVLQTFLSEARGKALLHKNGIDTTEGYKKEQEKQKNVETVLQKKTEEVQKIEEEKQRKLMEELARAGFDVSYSGSYGDKSGIVGGSDAGSFDGNVVGVDPVSGSSAEKIVQMAQQAYAKRGPNSGNPIRYSMDTSLRSSKIFAGATHADCSAFVQGVVRAAVNVDVGGNTAEQVTKNKSRTWVYTISELQPGDLIYFKTLSGDSYSGNPVILANGKTARVNHTLIYIGNNECIECTRGGGANGLRKFNFSSGWFRTSYMEKRFVGAFRL